MTATTSINVVGFPNPVPVNGESTDTSVVTAFTNAFVVIDNIFNNANGSPPIPPTNIDYSNMLDAVGSLQQLLQNGLPDPSGGTFVVTEQMAQFYNDLIGSLTAVNFFGALTPTDQLNAIKQWTDLSNVGLNNIVQEGVTAAQTGGKNVQAMVLSDYVKAGNDLLTNNLNSLYSAVSVTQSATATLQALQALHNDVTSETRNLSHLSSLLANPEDFNPASYKIGFNIKPGFTFIVNEANEVNVFVYLSVINPTNHPSYFIHFSYFVSPQQFSSVGAFLNEFFPQISAYFSQPLKIIYDDSSNTTNPLAPSVQTVTNFVQIKNQLTQEIAQLDQINHITDPSQRPSGSLQTQLQQVLDDMNNATGSSIQDQIVNWTLDGYNNVALKNPNSSINAGNIQLNITAAITGSQSLNSSQSEQLQQAMFVYQQYLESASSVISQLQTLMDKFTQGMKGV